MLKLCLVCGLRAEAHHIFAPAMPPGCVCDPGEWGEDVREPCEHYVGNGNEYCRRCEHDAGCHAAASAA